MENTMTKTHKLVSKMEDAAHYMAEAAEWTHHSLDQATYEFDRLSCEDDFTTGPEDDCQYLHDDMDEAVEMVSEYTQEVIDGIRELDRALAEMIKLRGQLAEEIGIPSAGIYN